MAESRGWGEEGSAGSSRGLGRCLVDLGLERCVQSPVCIGAINPLWDRESSSSCDVWNVEWAGIDDTD